MSEIFEIRFSFKVHVIAWHERKKDRVENRMQSSNRFNFVVKTDIKIPDTVLEAMSA